MDLGQRAAEDVYRVCEVQVLDQEGEEESKEAFYARVEKDSPEKQRKTRTQHVLEDFGFHP